MSFNINNKLSFIYVFDFLSSSLDRLIKKLSQDDFKFFSQEFENNMLNLVMHKEF